jgi:hypothetical protein
MALDLTHASDQAPLHGRCRINADFLQGLFLRGLRKLPRKQI